MENEGPVLLEMVIKQLREEQETNKQFIFEYKRKIHSLEILEREYQEEIERLNQDKIDVEHKLEIKTEQFEEEKCHIMNSNQEEVQVLLKHLAEVQQENERLKNEIDLEKMNEYSTIHEESSREDIEELKNKIRELEEEIKNLIMQQNLYQKQCSDLEEMQQILKSENEGLQENCDFKRDELRQANELIQDLQDDIVCLKTELDAMKNKPLDELSRGNSLFAEVNDSRVQLMKQLKTLMVKYNKMAKDRENLLKEIQGLRSDKAKMMQLFETDIEQYRPGNRREIDAYKSTIDGLRKLTENYKQEVTNLKKCDNSASSKDLKYYESCLKSKDKEIESLRDTLELHSTSHILKARNLSQLGREMVNWKWTASQFENQVEMLNKKVKELEEGYNKELRKSSMTVTDFDEPFENVKENRVSENISKVNNEIVQTCNVLKEKPCIENVACEVITSQKTEKLEQKTVQLNEDKEIVIDLTDDNEIEPKKTVHFCDNTKKVSEKGPLRKCAVIVNKHLPISSFCKTNTK